MYYMVFICYDPYRLMVIMMSILILVFTFDGMYFGNSQAIL